MSFHTYKGIRIGPNLRPKPNPTISDTFKRYDLENPNLPIETLIHMTAKHHNLSYETTIAALWG